MKHIGTSIRASLLIAIFGLLPAGLVLAQEQTLEWRIEQIARLRVNEVRQFLIDLKEGIASENAKAICDMMEYPLRTTSVSVPTAAACRTNYSTIFDKEVVRAVSAQRFEDLFANYQGVMIGSGQIWFAGICRGEHCERYDVKIIAVNH